MDIWGNEGKRLRVFCQIERELGKILYLFGLKFSVSFPR